MSEIKVPTKHTLESILSPESPCIKIYNEEVAEGIAKLLEKQKNGETINLEKLYEEKIMSPVLSPSGNKNFAFLQFICSQNNLPTEFISQIIKDFENWDTKLKVSTAQDKSELYMAMYLLMKNNNVSFSDMIEIFKIILDPVFKYSLHIDLEYSFDKPNTYENNMLKGLTSSILNIYEDSKLGVRFVLDAYNKRLLSCALQKIDDEDFLKEILNEYGEDDNLKDCIKKAIFKNKTFSDNEIKKEILYYFLDTDAIKEEDFVNGFTPDITSDLYMSTVSSVFDLSTNLKNSNSGVPLSEYSKEDNKAFIFGEKMLRLLLKKDCLTEAQQLDFANRLKNIAGFVSIAIDLCQCTKYPSVVYVLAQSRNLALKRFALAHPLAFSGSKEQSEKMCSFLNKEVQKIDKKKTKSEIELNFLTAVMKNNDKVSPIFSDILVYSSKKPYYRELSNVMCSASVENSVLKSYVNMLATNSDIPLYDYPYGVIASDYLYGVINEYVSRKENEEKLTEKNLTRKDICEAVASLRGYLSNKSNWSYENIISRFCEFSGNFNTESEVFPDIYFYAVNKRPEYNPCYNNVVASLQKLSDICFFIKSAIKSEIKKENLIDDANHSADRVIKISKNWLKFIDCVDKTTEQFSTGNFHISENSEKYFLEDYLAGRIKSFSMRNKYSLQIYKNISAFMKEISPVYNELERFETTPKISKEKLSER